MVPIFKTGRHTSLNGVERDWTAEDLDRIVATYNGQSTDSRHDAPAVVGHPKLDAPAWGFFNRLERKGNLLFGELRDARDEFVQWVRDGHYRKVSPKFDQNLLLKHVGWLGATPPAVKGLPEFSFSGEAAGESWETAFSEMEIAESTRTIEGDMGDTQKIRPDRADEQNDAGQTGAEASAGSGVGATGAAGGSPTPAQAPSADGVSVAEFAEYRRKQEEEQSALRAQLREQQLRNRELEFSEYLGRDELRGRVTPAMKPGLIRLMHTLADSQQSYEFSEVGADGQAVTVRRSPLDELKGLIGALPVSVEFGEMATGGRLQQVGTQEFSEADEKAVEALVDGSLGGAA